MPLNDVPRWPSGPSERAPVYEERWEQGGLAFLWAFNDLILDRRANETAADFVRDKIHQIVDDQAVADLLAADDRRRLQAAVRGHRLLRHLQPGQRELVDVSASPIEITPRGLRTGDRDYELDCLVFATGFDAMTGALLRRSTSAAAAG